MWDTVECHTGPLSRDMPCQRCGHALHTVLSCGDACECGPALMPGERHLVTA